MEEECLEMHDFTNIFMVWAAVNRRMRMGEQVYVRAPGAMASKLLARYRCNRVHESGDVYRVLGKQTGK